MNKSKLLIFALALLPIGNIAAEEVDTLKIVDVEEVLIIAAPKENRKLRELPNAVTLLSQQDMQAAQVNSIKNLTALVPNIFIPDYGSRLTSAVYIRGIGSRINTPSVGLYVDNIPYIDKSAIDFNYSDILSVLMCCAVRRVHCTDEMRWAESSKYIPNPLSLIKVLISV